MMKLEAKILALVTSLLVILGIFAKSVQAESSLNGFDLAEASVPVDLIKRGGPPRDGIPSIDRPKFIEAFEASEWLADDEFVMGIDYAGIVRAYPIAIMNWHELVNDKFDKTSVLISFCPLCGTGIVFLPEGNKATFGVSGLLYNSDVLLYDHKSESLWSQVLAEAVTGKRIGEKLTILPSLHTTWEQWQQEHPDTLVLSRETGHQRNYEHDPYESYSRVPETYFPVENKPDGLLHPKERVIGIKIGETTKAYPFTYLEKQDKSIFTDTVADQEIVVNWNKKAPVAWIEDSQGTTLATVDGFWFAWFAFYPQTEVFEAP